MESEPKLIRDLEAKQQNIVWPGPIRNTDAIDSLLWKGSPSPSRVQRAGMLVFGATVCGIGVCFFLFARSSASRLLGYIGVGTLFVGVRILFNGFRRRTESKP